MIRSNGHVSPGGGAPLSNGASSMHSERNLMAKTRFRVGAEMDIVSGDELRAATSELSARIDRLTSRAVPRERMIRRIVGAINTDGAGAGSTTIGAPPPGFIWEVKRTAISGPDPTSAIAGRAMVFVAESQPSRLLDFTLTIPDVGPWNGDQITLTSEEPLFVQITGGAATTRYIFSCEVWEREAMYAETEDKGPAAPDDETEGE